MGSLTDDLRSVMIRQQLNGALTEEELVSESVSIMQASVDSTVHQMGIVIGEFVERPDLWRRLVSEPAFIAPAIEEVIRYRPRWGTSYRLAAEDVQIRDQVIPKDSWVSFPPVPVSATIPSLIILMNSVRIGRRCALSCLAAEYTIALASISLACWQCAPT